MQASRLIRSVRLGALILMIIVAAEMVRYGITAFAEAWDFSLGSPTRWNTHWAVDTGTVIANGARLSYFALWVSVILASLLCFVIGLFLLNRARRGLLFDRVMARGISALGLALAFALAYDQLFQAVDLYLVTRFNAAGPEPIDWRYDPSDYKAISLGLLLFLFGGVVQRAIGIARENAGYV